MTSYCPAQQQYDQPCSNRDKCKKKNQNDSPERDGIPRGKQPPEPPSGDDWELQYCNWSGWTWVKKGDRDGGAPPKQNVKMSDDAASQERRPSDKKKVKQPEKKKGGFFSCFGKKENKPPPQPPVAEQNTQAGSGTSIRNRGTQRGLGGRGFDDDFDDMNACYCLCNQVCCPCMLQNQCCCCCQQEQDSCKKNCETQTCCEVKEQATKTSELSVPKRMPMSMSGKKRRCICARPVCCPCMRGCCCCRCVQKTCCPCKNGDDGNNTKKDKDIQDSVKNTSNSDIVNYCLTKHYRKPDKGNEVMSFKKTSSFSTLHKSLDLLLKNNINIMNLFHKKMELNGNNSRLSSNHTITSLPHDNIGKKSDQEHHKLLTAVCDAILSSHKFDSDKFSSNIHPSQKSSQKHFDLKDSQHSVNIYRDGNLIEKLLKESNFSTLTQNDDNPNRKKSSTKMVKNKSRILSTPRFPNRAEALRRYVEFMKFDKNTRRCMNKKTEKKQRGGQENKLILTEIFKNDAGQASTSFQNNPRTETIDTLLNSLDLAYGRNTDQNDNGRLEETVPPTDLDLLLTFHNHKRDGKTK